MNIILSILEAMCVLSFIGMLIGLFVGIIIGTLI